MPDLSVSDWMAAHYAPAELSQWASTFATMSDVWDAAPEHWRIWIACSPGVLSDAVLRGFAIWSASQVSEWVNAYGVAALAAAAAYASGTGSIGDMTTARTAAFASIQSLRGADACASMAAALTCHTVGQWAMPCAHNAAVAARIGAIAAEVAAAAEAGDTMHPSDLVSVGATAFVAAATAQADWLLENVTPDFSA